jgi:hypothetical protein
LRAINEIGFFAVLEIKGDVVQKRGLIGFYCEVVMGMLVFNKIPGNIPLG